MSSTSDTSKARQRIQSAYDPELLRAAGHRLADLLGEHFQRVELGVGDVLPWYAPSENLAEAARAISADCPLTASRDSLAEYFGQVVEQMLGRGLNLHNPRYIGHQVPAPVPIAGLFDAVGSVTNQCMAVYEMGPWATAVEQALVDQLGEQIGWRRGEFAGLATHGGSLANLTGLLTARNVTLGDSWEGGVSSVQGKPVLVAQADAHYSVARSAGVLGIGTNQIIRAELDQRRRMDPNRLDETLHSLRSKNVPVVAVAAGACATPIGAFDPLRDVADVCRRHGVWMHVDAAHGGSACMSQRYRHLVDGLDRADSVVWDAHKMLFVPSLCAFVFYRNRDHRFEAFRQDAPYLFDPSAPGLADYDSGMKTIECTKRAAAYGLWGIWSLFGPQLFADLVDVTFDMGRVLYDKLSESADFEPLHEPECNIVVFRHVPDALRDAPPDHLGNFQFDLRRKLVESGEFYIVSTRIDGVGALRVTIINPLTTSDHLDQLLDALREHGKRLVKETA